MATPSHYRLERNGPATDFVDPGETAWHVLEAALEPLCENMLKYQQLSMLEQAETVCSGILTGIYDFQWYSSTEFKDWAVDSLVGMLEATFVLEKTGFCILQLIDVARPTGRDL